VEKFRGQELERRQIKDSGKKVKQLSEPRINPLEGEWHKSLTQEYNSFNMFYDGKIINILRTVANHPKLMKSWYPFFIHMVGGSRLPRRDMEIIILRITWLCQSEYAWSRHAASAIEIGVSEEEIKRITIGSEAEGWSDFERTLLRAVDELYIDAFISEETWKALSEKYNTQKLMALIFLVGEYNLVSMFLNSVGVQLDESRKPKTMKTEIQKGFPE